MGRHSEEDGNKKDTISTDGEEKGRPIPDDIPGRHEKKEDDGPTRQAEPFGFWDVADRLLEPNAPRS